MIAAVATAAQRAEFLRRLAARPFFAATMGTHLALFGEKTGCGWGFYLLPGGAALATMGTAASLCGLLPGAQDAAELAAFLAFMGVDKVSCERPVLTGQPGWGRPKALYRRTLPGGAALPLPPRPAVLDGLILDRAPAMRPVSRLLFPDHPGEQDQFYSVACTSIAHGIGCCRALRQGDEVVSTVGCYERAPREAYLAAGVTEAARRGHGIGGWLIAETANELAAGGAAVTLLCEQERCRFYDRLGFPRSGLVWQYKRSGQQNNRSAQAPAPRNGVGRGAAKENNTER